MSKLAQNEICSRYRLCNRTYILYIYFYIYSSYTLAERDNTHTEPHMHEKQNKTSYLLSTVGHEHRVRFSPRKAVCHRAHALHIYI